MPSIPSWVPFCGRAKEDPEDIKKREDEEALAAVDEAPKAEGQEQIEDFDDEIQGAAIHNPATSTAAVQPSFIHSCQLGAVQGVERDIFRTYGRDRLASGP
eukprot:GHVH01016766.1.p3 GENE.GHVH01016766.1~~GHVH01016766.1.p3  ORF type:complete len:101 (+),score=21.79 GHVH01016766.1:90-392(+)